MTPRAKLEQAYRDGWYCLMEDTQTVRNTLSAWKRDTGISYKTFTFYGTIYVLFIENTVDFINNQ